MANKEATIAAALAETRPGHTQAPIAPAPSVTEGLELSDIVLKPVAWFRENPANAIFRPLKSDRYLEDLRRDVEEFGIVNPLVALQDGTLLEGESRVHVARDLGLARLPVRVVLSEVSEADQARRLWLGNLSRFEIDENTRLALYARIWPEAYKSERVKDRAAVAEATGKSERQVSRDAGIVREAAELAKAEGLTAPEPVHIATVRERKNEERKAAVGPRKIDAAALESALHDLKARGGQYAESAEFIRKAVGI